MKRVVLKLYHTRKLKSLIIVTHLRFWQILLCMCILCTTLQAGLKSIINSEVHMPTWANSVLAPHYFEYGSMNMGLLWTWVYFEYGSLLLHLRKIYPAFWKSYDKSAIALRTCLKPFAWGHGEGQSWGTSEYNISLSGKTSVMVHSEYWG